MKNILVMLLLLGFGPISCAVHSPQTSSHAAVEAEAEIRARVEPLDCPKPVPAPVITCPEPVPLDRHDGKQVIGEAEYALVDPPGLRLRARIDTGATTTSVHAVDIQPFERDGEKWVRFQMIDPKTDGYRKVESKVVRIASIKRHGADEIERPTVRLRITLGTTSLPVEVTLADRGGFEYPVLIGRNFLRGTSVVDVSGEYLAKNPERTEP